MPVNIFTTRFMMKLLEEIRNPSSFMLDTFFTQSEANDQEIAEFDIITDPQTKASPQSPKLPAKAVQAIGFKTKTTPRAYFSEKIPCEAWNMMQNRLPGETPYADDSVTQRATVRMARDLGHLRRRLRRSYELMAIEALTTGKCAVKGDGVNFEVDYEYDDSNLITLSGNDIWTSPGTAKIYGMLKEQVVDIQQRSGFNVDNVILGTEAAKLFVENAEIQKLLDLRRFEMGSIAPVRQINGLTHIGYFPEIGNVWSYNWATVNDGGNLVTAFPKYGCLMGCSDAVNWRLYGPVPSFTAPRYTEEYADVFEEKDPEMKWTRLRSTFIPGLLYPKAFKFLTVGSVGSGTVTSVSVTGITLSDETKTLSIGDVYALTASITPANASVKNVRWSSSNDAVATVVNGVITAVGSGKATITARTDDGDFIDVCEVTVSTVAVTGVTFNTDTLSLNVGAASKLTATVAPVFATNKNAVFVSDNQAVAVVAADGTVTAVGAGTANITVTTADGSKTDTCAVNVTAA